MKKCSACAKDLPDTAMHCVFCGAKQAPAPAQANPQAKTVMGYAAADLLKQMGPRPGAAPAAAPQAAPPPQAFQPPPPQGFPPPQQPQGFPPPQAAPPPQAFQPPPPQGLPPAPQGGQFGGSASTAATMFMQPAPQIPQPQASPPPQAFQPPPQQPPPQQFQPPPQQFQPPQQPQGYPPAQQPQGYPPPQQPQGYPPPQQPQGYPPPQQPQGYPPPGGGFGPGGPGGMAGYNPMPAGPMGGQPPFLASQTAARMGRPTEPFNDLMKLVLIAFGAALLVFFVVPVVTKPAMGFQWDAIIHGKGIQILVPLLIVAGGVLGLVFGLMPLAPVGRGGLAALLGVVPLVLMVTVIGSFDWHALAEVLGGILLVTGLLLRNEYTGDPLPRIFIFVGAVATVLPLFVPFQIVDIIKAMFESFVHPAALVHVMGQFVPILFALVAVVIALIPGPAKAGARSLAWTILLWPAALQYAELTADGHIGDAISAAPGPSLLAWALPVAFTAFAAFGLAVLFGKQLEMSK